MMKRALGATADLSSKIKTHFFLICPNNSGSTFFIRAVEKSKSVWSLKHEGQHVLDYAGPNTRQDPGAFIWASTPELLDLYSDPKNYNWNKIQRVWYFQASAIQSEATVFATKSPPFLLLTDQLYEYFSNVKFAFMVRNPYAVIESICRARALIDSTGDERFEVAARHVAYCLAQQRHNIQTYGSNSIFFTYEDFCRSPQDVKTKLAGLVPELDDVSFDIQISVKGRYNETLRDMNQQQIEKLSDKAIVSINSVLEKHTNDLTYFGYNLLR